MVPPNCQSFSHFAQLENSFPPNISALYKSGKLKVQTESLQEGSIIVRLRITVQDPEFPVDVSTFAPLLSYLHNSSVLLVDQENTAVEGNFFFPKGTRVCILITHSITSILHEKYL